jgi:hypothetical protein
MKKETKKKTVQFEIGTLFWTPQTEQEYKNFIERYNGSEKALVALSGQIAMNYILRSKRLRASVVNYNADEIRNKKRRGKTMELIVEKKSVYGNQLIYPVCNKAKLFASISGNKTLLPEVIEDIKKLGYKLTTKEEQI